MEEYIKSIANTLLLLSKPSWLDYCQTFVSVISIIISAWAVIMAIKIPKKIAYKQDKIALFNRRIASYDVLQKYMLFADSVNKCGTCNEWLVYKRIIEAIFFVGNIDLVETKTAINELINQSIFLKNMPYLFDDIAKVEVDELISSLIMFAMAIISNTDIETFKQKYVEVVEKFNNAHNEYILEMLKME